MDIPYLEPEDLAEMIRDVKVGEKKKFVVVDVRDDDFVGGNISSAVNLPSESFHQTGLPVLEQHMQDGVTTFVFHCMMSQQRGPAAARAFHNRCKQAGKSHVINISILRGGYRKWEYRYGNMNDLVENH
eukprot:GSChrysophyteH1.ASY1.ANO1.1007.1 assembled CDS